VANKDRGGKSPKRPATKGLKEKRQDKRTKRAGSDGKAKKIT
jgi:hypothetical protein